MKAIDNLKAELELAISKLTQDKAGPKPQAKPGEQPGRPSLFDLIGSTEEEPETPEDEDEDEEEAKYKEPLPLPPKPSPKDKGPKPKDKVPPT